MSNAPYTILGAGGAIGAPLAQQLIENGQPVRLLSRSGAGMEGAESRRTDVFQPDELRAGIRGSKVVYLLVGLEYKTAVWQQKWPLLMENVLRACAQEGVPLIFFDNVYMYGRVEGKMTEETPFRPVSKKGEVRAKVAQLLLEAVQRGDVKASIARSADFYGPWASTTSMFYQTVIKNITEGKKPMWMGNPTAPHAMSYTLDCARALRLLTDTPDSFNQTWHMPTSNPAPTPEDLIRMTSEAMGAPYKGVQAVPTWLVRGLGIFMPIMREMVEMMYQFNEPYWFDSSKFESRFQFQPTSYESGIQETLAFFKLLKST